MCFMCFTLVGDPVIWFTWHPHGPHCTNICELHLQALLHAKCLAVSLLQAQRPFAATNRISHLHLRPDATKRRVQPQTANAGKSLCWWVCRFISDARPLHMVHRLHRKHSNIWSCTWKFAHVWHLGGVSVLPALLLFLLLCSWRKRVLDVYRFCHNCCGKTHTGAPLKCVLLSVCSVKLAPRRVKSVCARVISPMEMNSKHTHELTALAPGLPPPLKPSMSEVFPGPRTNYLQPPVTPAAKVIIGVSLSRPRRSSSSATHSHGWKARAQTCGWTQRVERSDAFATEKNL